jgi:uncharacterized membrane protein
MRFKSRRLLVALGVLSLIVLLVYASSVQSSTIISSTNLSVYRDGVVHVEQTLEIGALAPEATVTLLSEKIENLLILDEKQLAVDYQLIDNDLLIYSFGAEQVDLEYDVNTLTSKKNEVWTLLLDCPYSLNIVFPINSSIVYLNDTPTSIDTSNSQLHLSVDPGQWEISYLLSIVAGDNDNLNPDFFQPTGMVPLEYVIAIVFVGVAFFAVGFLVFVRKRKPNIKKALNANPHLMREDKEVLEFLAENDGKAFEAEIRARFPDMPRTSLWRLIKRLEKNDIVEVKKIGLENQVILKK